MNFARRIFKRLKKMIANNMVIFIVFVAVITFTTIASLVLHYCFEQPFWPTFSNQVISALTRQYPNLKAGVWYNDLIKGLSYIIGLFITGIVVAELTAFFSENHRKRRSGMNIPAVVEHTIICGWNESGDKIIRSIHQENKNIDIVVISNRESAPATGSRIHWIKGDFTCQEALVRAYVKDCKTAIVLADISEAGGVEDYADCRTILAILTIEKLNHKIHTAAELVNPARRQHLENAGVDEIVIRGEISGSILSRISENRGLSKVISKLLEFGEGSEFYKVSCPASFAGKKFGDLLTRLYEEKTYLLIGFEKPNGDIVISPKHDVILDNPSYIYIISDVMPRF